MTSFSGAVTQWKDVPGVVPGTWTQSNDSEANSKAKDIEKRIENLRRDAEALAVQAAELVDDCAEFDPASVNVNMPMPTYTAGAFADSIAVDNLVLQAVPSVAGLEDFVFTQAAGSFAFDANSAAPTASDPTPFPIPGATPDIALPQDTTATEFALPTTPGFLTFSDTLPAQPLAPSIPDVGFNASFIDAQDIPSVAVSSAKLEAILNSVMTAAGNLETNIPDFEELNYSPTKLDVAHEDYHAARDVELTDYRSAILRGVWTQRGVDTSYNDDIVPYVNRRAALDAADAADVGAAERHRYTIADARQDIGLAVALYGQTVEVQSSLFGARIAQLETQAQAQRFLWEATTSSYRGALMVLSAELSNNELANQALGLDASVYKSRLRRHSLLATQNSLRHTVFAAEENAKRVYGIQANTAASNLRAEITQHRVLTAFKASKLRRLGDRITRFRQDIAIWQAELAKVDADYTVYAAKARAAAVENGLIAAKVQSTDVDLDRVAELNRRLALNTRIVVADAQLAARARSVDNVQVTAANQISGQEAELRATEYGVYAALSGVTDVAARADLTGISVENEAASRFFISASEGMHRAASIAQQANIQLAEAYNRAQDVSGKAYGSIEAGRLSGWTASAALQASGSLSAGVSQKRQQVESYNESVTEADREVKDETNT